MKVRELRESDHRQVVSVVDRWWGGRRVADKLPRLFFRYFRETSFVVEEDEAMIAFLIGFVGVHPGHRNRGIGRRLYAAFFEEARLRGCRRVRCITSPVNENSIAFH